MATIAIFDSGVGGLSVYREVNQRLPEHDYVFISDNQAFPYGTKSDEELHQRVTQLVAALANQYQPDLLVIACNTASTIMLPTLRKQFSFSIVGVVPAIKPAAEFSQTKVIGLLATPATIARAYTNELITEFASDCKVIKLGSSELVQLAEDKLRGKAIDLAGLSNLLKPLIRVQEMDVLVLACTHFPLLAQEVKQVFEQEQRTVKIIDSGAAIANRVADLLESDQAINSLTRARKSQSTAAFTAILTDTHLASELLTQGFSEVQTLRLV